MDWFKNFNFSDGSQYRINRLLMLLVIVAMVALAIYVLSLDNFSGGNHYYVECNSKDGSACKNPYYNNILCGSKVEATSPVCSQEFILNGGHIGEKPPLIYSYFYYLLAGIFLFVILVNHFAFNSKFNFNGIFTESKQLVLTPKVYKQEKSFNLWLKITIMAGTALIAFLYPNLLAKIFATFISVYIFGSIVENLIRKKLKNKFEDSPIGGEFDESKKQG